MVINAPHQTQPAAWPAAPGLYSTPALAWRVTPSHQSVSGLTEQAYYALIDIVPARNLQPTRLPLNLCLVLDRSTSMRGQSLQKTKEAVHHIIDQLQPQDILSVVVFSDRAELILPGQPNINKPWAKAIVSAVQPGGGTEMLPALQAGLKELERNRSARTINHLILLTDGQTYGDEPECLDRARWAGLHQIHLSTIGLGNDWNEELLDRMAASSAGTSVYIEAPDQVKNVFGEIMRNLESIVARNVTLHLELAPYIQMTDIYQVNPQICRLAWPGKSVTLGAISAGQTLSVLVELRLPQLPAGQASLLRLSVEADIPGQPNFQPPAWVNLTAKINPDAPPAIRPPRAIKLAASKIAIVKMQEKVTTDLQDGEVSKAAQRLRNMAARLRELGERKLARAALREANRLVRTKQLSAAGRKRIKYGTRMLAGSLNFTLPATAPAAACPI